MIILQEDTRKQIDSKARRGADYRGDKSKGRNRWARSRVVTVSSTVKDYNLIDMNQLFKQDVLDVKIKVNGEVHKGNSKGEDYFVEICFNGVVEKMRQQIEKDSGAFDLRTVRLALNQCFNNNDIYFFCTCPDFHYRIGYWASMNDLIVGEKETRPSDITNPDDIWGPACKHICAVLRKQQWCTKVASTIYNYVNYMESHYKQAYRGIIYPALYGKDYELSDEQNKNKYFYKSKDSERLGQDTDLLDTSNKKARYSHKKTRDDDKRSIRFSKETGEPIPDEED